MATMTKTKLQNYIDGEFVDAADGATEEVTNPANGEVIAEMPLSNEEDVNRAVAAAKKAFGEWSVTPPGERATALLKLADLIEEHADEIADLEAADAGKPRSAFLEDELPFLCDNLRFFAGAARLPEGQASGEYLAGHTSIIRREPVGPVGQITPWNYPLMMAVWKIGPALAAGNTVVLKPADATPLSTLKLAELAGGGAAADTLKKVHLELGGKAPVIVFDDVEMETAMEAIAGAGYYNAGQDCTAATRVLASDRVYDDVVSGLAGEAKGLVLGDTLDEETTL